MSESLPPPRWPRTFGPPNVSPLQHHENLTAGLRSSAALGSAIIVLLWIEFGAIASTVAAQVYERWAIDKVVGSGEQPRSALRRLDHAGSYAALAAAVGTLVGIALVILLAVWSLRVTRNAQNRGIADLRPGLAAGGWFIPFAGAVVPFVQLRRAARPFLGATTSITTWQVCMISGALSSRLGWDEAEHAETLTQLSDALSQLVAYNTFAAVTFAIGVTSGRRAINAIDRAVSLAPVRP